MVIQYRKHMFIFFFLITSISNENKIKAEDILQAITANYYEYPQVCRYLELYFDIPSLHKCVTSKDHSSAPQQSHSLQFPRAGAIVQFIQLNKIKYPKVCCYLLSCYIQSFDMLQPTPDSLPPNSSYQTRSTIAGTKRKRSWEPLQKEFDQQPKRTRKEEKNGVRYDLRASTLMKRFKNTS